MATRRRVARLAVVASLVVAGRTFAAGDSSREVEGTLLAGPLLGPVGPTHAVVWVETRRPARVGVEWQPAGEVAGTAAPRSIEQRTRDDDGLVVHLHLDELTPATTYRYRVLLDGVPISKPYPLELRTPAVFDRGDATAVPPPLTVAFGSCAWVPDPGHDLPGWDPKSDPGIFDAIARAKPDLMLWIGDNFYLRDSDLRSGEAMAARWRRDRAAPRTSRLFAATSNQATWDDHDFGPNDSDGTFRWKSLSLVLFRRYWPSERLGLPETPGVFRTVPLGDVDFFLLDDRTYRSPQRTRDGAAKGMLGAAQLDWLLGELERSRATFKVIVSGNQVLNLKSGWESMAQFPTERARLLGEIRARRIGGVLLLSGDRHHGELIRRDDAGYPLYDFTSSPLAARVRGIGPEDPEYDNPDRVPGTLVSGQNFGLLRFEGARAGRRVVLEAHGSDGATLWRVPVERRALEPPDAVGSDSVAR